MEINSKVIWILWLFNAILILSLAPTARMIRHWAENYLSEDSYLYIALGLLLPAVIFLAYFVSKNRTFFSIKNIIASIVFFALLAMKIWALRDNSIEAMHIILYSSFTFISAVALRQSFNGLAVHITALLMCIGLGMIDELFQWYSKGRYGELADVFHLNAQAGIYVLIFLAVIVIADFKYLTNNLSGKKFLISSFYVFLFLFTIFINLTPKNVASFSKNNSWLKPKLTDDSYLSGTIEYGYVHEIKGLGKFKSRTKSLEDFKTRDQEMSEEVENLKKQFPEDNTKNPILKHWSLRFMGLEKSENPNWRWQDPIHYETKLRAYNRDRVLERSQDPKYADKKQTYLERAYYYNEFLIATMPKTIVSLNLILPEETLKTITPEEKNTTAFSRISKNLTTKFTQTQGNIFLAIVFVLATFAFLKWRLR